MLGLMQDYPLLTHTIIDHGALNHGEREMVTRSVEGPLRRCTLADVRSRALRVAKALEWDGVKLGDRVATMAWNTERHIEAWFGIMGLGAICHTLNPRLFAEQLDYIVNHAEDEIVFVDLTFVPILEALHGRLGTVRKYIVLTDAEHMPDTALPNAVAYEEWIAGVDDDFAWKQFDENTAAALCYTSGTTGNPKGVLYSHRSNVLHGLMANQPDVFGLRSEDSLLAIVPMFHANAWALTFSVPAAGAKMVLPGAGMDGASIYELLEDEKVTATAAVPTVWLGLLQYLEQTGKKLPHLNRVVVGGAACPPMMIRKFELDYGVELIHGWGMTEMSPIGTTGKMKHATSGLDREAQLKLKEKQGRTPYLVEMKVVDDDGNELPRDGQSSGHLLVKGPCVAKGYHKLEESALDEDGWFDTGDVANIDPDGYLQITDRIKDVIKSGGEWVSSLDLENLLSQHEAVLESAAIGVPDDKWGEVPIAAVVLMPGAGLNPAELMEWTNSRVDAKFQRIRDVVFYEEFPRNVAGKTLKREMRGKYERG